jgi:AcrR family transcriptional regulator
MSTEDFSSAYHHGDLRRALLDAASAILAETGKWDFSLREVARRAGVSHNAPYRHFADKEALLSAVAVLGFEALRGHTAAAAQGKANAVEALTAIGTAYIGFGVDNPALYRLMFGRGLTISLSASLEVVEAARSNRAVVRDTILSGARSGQFTVDAENPADVVATIVAAGSLVHGLTLFTIDGVVERVVDQEPANNLVAGVLRRFIIGLTYPQG